MFVSSFCSELLPQRRGLPCLLGIEAQSHVGIVVLHGVKTHFRVVWRGINENQGYETKSGHVIRHKTCNLLKTVATFVKTSKNGLSVWFVNVHNKSDRDCVSCETFFSLLTYTDCAGPRPLPGNGDL